MIIPIPIQLHSFLDLMVYATGYVMPALCIVIVGHIDCTLPYVAVAFMMTCLGFMAFGTAGVGPNHMELAPPFAGSIMGILNTAANISGVIVPSIVAAMTEQVSYKYAFN